MSETKTLKLILVYMLHCAQIMHIQVIWTDRRCPSNERDFELNNPNVLSLYFQLSSTLSYGVHEKQIIRNRARWTSLFAMAWHAVQYN